MNVIQKMLSLVTGCIVLSKIVTPIILRLTHFNSCDQIWNVTNYINTLSNVIIHYLRTKLRHWHESFHFMPLYVSTHNLHPYNLTAIM